MISVELDELEAAIGEHSCSPGNRNDCAGCVGGRALLGRALPLWLGWGDQLPASHAEMEHLHRMLARHDLLASMWFDAMRLISDLEPGLTTVRGWLLPPVEAWPDDLANLGSYGEQIEATLAYLVADDEMRAMQVWQQWWQELSPHETQVLDATLATIAGQLLMQHTTGMQRAAFMLLLAAGDTAGRPSRAAEYVHGDTGIGLRAARVCGAIADDDTQTALGLLLEAGMQDRLAYLVYALAYCLAAEKGAQAALNAVLYLPDGQMLAVPDPGSVDDLSAIGDKRLRAAVAAGQLLAAIEVDPEADHEAAFLRLRDQLDGSTAALLDVAYVLAAWLSYVVAAYAKELT